MNGAAAVSISKVDGVGVRARGEADVVAREGVSERARCVKRVDEGVNICALVHTSSK